MDTNGHIILCEDYVNFEVAKLLKEKGFNEPCYSSYKKGVFSLDSYAMTNIEFNKNAISAPTLQMAMKWLREVHNIFIDICTLSPLVYIYRVCLISDTTGYFYEDYACEEGERFMSYKEAVEFALDYCLNNILEV